MQQEDRHAYLRLEWAKLWEEIRSIPYKRLAEKQQEISAKMAHLEEISKEIGGSVFQEFEKIFSDVKRFLLGAMPLSEMHQMMEHSLKIEQDTREL